MKIMNVMNIMVAKIISNSSSSSSSSSSSFSISSRSSSIVVLSKKWKLKYVSNNNISLVLYGCGTWSLALRKERRLTVFENEILMRIFEPIGDENGGWSR